MNYREIIAESWAYTQSQKRLIIWLGFIPALFTTTVSVGYMAYQVFALKKSYLFDDAEDSFFHDVLSFMWSFIKEHISWTAPLVVVLIFFGIGYFLIPTIARASAIQKIARDRNGQNASVGTGIRYGIMSFLPLLEYHLLIKAFAFFAILVEMSFVLRNLGPTIFKLLSPVFFLLIIISLFLTLLFVYADFFIVIDKARVFESMKKSAKLVVTNWKHTFLIMVLMLIIGIRIIIQAIIIFLIPVLIVLITGYVASVAVPAVGIIIGGVIGIIGLIFASYLNGVVDIFSYAVWTFSFLKMTSEKEVEARDISDGIRHENS